MTFNELIESKTPLMESLGSLLSLYNGDGNNRSYYRLKDIKIHQPEHDYADCIVMQVPYCYHIDLMMECYKGPSKGWHETYTLEVPKMCEHGFLITDQSHSKVKFRSPILVGEFYKKLSYKGKKSSHNRVINIGNYIHIYVDPAEDDEYPSITVKVDDKKNPIVKYPLVDYLLHYGIKKSELPKELGKPYGKEIKGEYVLISLPEDDIEYYNNKILQLTKHDYKLSKKSPYLTAEIIFNLVKLVINTPLVFEGFTPFDVSWMDTFKALFDIDLQRQKSIKRKLSTMIETGDIGFSLTKHIYAAFNMQTESGAIQVASTCNAISFLSQSRKIYFKKYRETKKEPIIYTKDFYGIICPTKTPENVAQTSVKNEVALDVDFDEHHNIVISVVPKESFLKGDMTPVEISYAEYYKSRILSIDNIDYRIKKVIPIKGKVKIFQYGDFTEIEYKNDECFDYIRKSPEGALAYNSALIPFANKCDGTRLAMATNMIDQAIPVLGSKPSIVKTHVNRLIFDKSNFNIKSPVKGTVVRIVNGYITIQLSDKSYRTFAVPDTINTSMHTSNRFIPYVNLGDEVKVNDILFISDSFKGNELALTVPLRVAYYSYGMLTSDDAIVISKSASELLSHKITHYIRVTIPSESLAVFNKSEVIEAMKKKNRLQFYEKSLRKLNEFGMPEIGSTYSNLDHEYLAIYLFANIDGMSVKGSLSKTIRTKEKKARNQLYDININSIPNEMGEGVVENIRLFHRDDPEVNKRYKDIIDFYERLEEQRIDEITGGLNTTVPDFNIDLDADEADLEFIITISEVNECGIASKLSTRYASKGTVSDVLPDEMMPRINDEDGLPIQILIPPKSTINRKNIAQIYEMNLCLMCKIAYDRNTELIKKKKFDKARDVLNKLYQTDKFNNYSDKNIIEFHNTFSEYYSVEVSAIDEIYTQKVMSDLCNYFDIDQDGYYLYDPVSTDRLTVEKITIGITEIMRLGFLPEVKAKATADILDAEEFVLYGGDVREGGQRVGEMERWQVVAYGIEAPFNNLLKRSGQLTLDESTNIMLYNEGRVAGINYLLYSGLNQ